VDAGDYDTRTALHVAAANGNLLAVKLLVEQGGAQVCLRDRCGLRLGWVGLGWAGLGWGGGELVS
jgi:ankyrin repeat protein